MKAQFIIALIMFLVMITGNGMNVLSYIFAPLDWLIAGHGEDIVNYSIGALILGSMIPIIPIVCFVVLIYWRITGK